MGVFAKIENAVVGEGHAQIKIKISGILKNEC